MTKLFAELDQINRNARMYWWITSLLGVVALAITLKGLFTAANDDLLKLLILTITVLLAGLFTIRIPGTHSAFTPSDIFVFLACLLLGAPAATLIAALDAWIGAYRASGRLTTRISAAGINAIAMCLAAQLFQWLIQQQLRITTNKAAWLFSALFLFACAYFLFSSALMALHSALRQHKPFLTYWWENYAWVATTYVASAAMAGLIYLGLERFGIVVIFAAAPIALVVFTTAHFYFRQAEERENAQQQRLAAAETQATQAKIHLQEMQASEQRFRSAFDFAAIGMALVSPQGDWVQVNPSLCQILGYPEAELLRSQFQDLTHTDDLAAVQRAITQLLSGDLSATQIEHRYIHSQGHEVWVSLNASLIGATAAQSTRLIFQIQNITDRKLAEDRLVHDAVHDALTGLPNRTLFLDHLKMAIARTNRHPDRTFAVLFLDFDRFKIINDSLGHLAGDELLSEVARRLTRSVRLGDTIARLGGDEFTILLEEISDAQEAIALAERIQTMLLEPIKLSATEVTVTVSIGIALSAHDYKKPEEVLRDADTAMYQAKSQGKARYALFDPSMHARALTQLQLENDLRRALEREEFFLVYQPIVSLQTGRLVGFEALVRWQHPERNLINPADFIAVAEETSLIIPLGHWVLRQACYQMQEWKKSVGNIPLTININLSGKQLVNDDVVARVMETLTETGLKAEDLKLEITESVVVENVEVAIRQLNHLRALGIKLSIDDFGTGYSSLSYLHRLPTNTLKIDRSFVARMVDQSENAEIVRTIVLLAQTLNMDVTAEGIETLEQLQHLQKLGVECAQGYFFSKPLEVAAATQLIEHAAQKHSFLPAQSPTTAFEIAASQGAA